MKRLLPILLCSLLLSGLRNATAQEASKTWTLQECLDYAYQNNIQVRQSRNNQLSGIEDTKQAKAALFPSLVASTTQSYTNYPSSEVTDNNSYTGTYGITAGMTIFEGGKLRTEVKRQKVQNQMDALSVEESVNDIRIAIVQAYMQCLYAADAVRINRSTAEASKALRDRAEEMLAKCVEAGAVIVAASSYPPTSVDPWGRAPSKSHLFFRHFQGIHDNHHHVRFS